jgi:acetylornithine/N-succinyldiaminopimelate aminotransferase
MPVSHRTAEVVSASDEACPAASAREPALADNYTVSRWPEVTANITPQGPQLVRGAGLRVWDADGREYLDMCGQTLNLALGHRHPVVAAART